MNAVIKIANQSDLILEIKAEGVLLDANVAQIYGVEKIKIKEAVKNNHDKFDQNYLFEFNDV